MMSDDLENSRRTREVFIEFRLIIEKGLGKKESTYLAFVYFEKDIENVDLYKLFITLRNTGLNYMDNGCYLLNNS